MKRIGVVPDPTPGLGEYLDSVENANWEEFRSHDAGASLRELRGTLARNQHSLCAYCEIEIKEPRRQIEHVIPRSGDAAGEQRALDIANMVACCMGGTVPVASPQGQERDDYFRTPVRDNMSCGQAKGNRRDEAFLEPRELPEYPSLVRVRDNGLLEVDHGACQAAGVRPDRVGRTIEILNLNAERLQLARQKWRSDLVEAAQRAGEADRMIAWIRAVLTPDRDGGLSRFFTTSRCYFGPEAERILDEQPRAWI